MYDWYAALVEYRSGISSCSYRAITAPKLTAPCAVDCSALRRNRIGCICSFTATEPERVGVSNSNRGGVQRGRSKSQSDGVAEDVPRHRGAETQLLSNSIGAGRDLTSISTIEMTLRANSVVLILISQASRDVAIHLKRSSAIYNNFTGCK
jgi:hypothetical protein